VPLHKAVAMSHARWTARPVNDGAEVPLRLRLPPHISSRNRVPCTQPSLAICMHTSSDRSVHTIDRCGCFRFLESFLGPSDPDLSSVQRVAAALSCLPSDELPPHAFEQTLDLPLDVAPPSCVHQPRTGQPTARINSRVWALSPPVIARQLEKA
jgi:hypothetical protein